MLIAQDLACLRGDRLLFNQVRFELNAGGLLYVLGENGSGKSSLLRLLCGLLTPEAGEVLWNGQNIKQESEIFQADLFYLGHLNGLKDDLTALENLQIRSKLSGNDVDKDQVLVALEAIGVARCTNLPVRVLSQGQKKRVALALLWLTKAKLWILDEPFAALDASSIEVLATHLSQHLSQGGMSIITTHQDVVINTQSTQTIRLSA